MKRRMDENSFQYGNQYGQPQGLAVHVGAPLNAW
jgi:hypothetical protein